MRAGIRAFTAGLAGVIFFLGVPQAPSLAQSAGGGSGAEAPTIRRVQVPPQGYTGPRINIQIEPAAAAPAEAAPTGPGARSAAAPPHAAPWFWAEVSPEMPADPRRFWAALNRIETADEAGMLIVPRLADLAAMAETHGRTLLAETIDTGVSPALALSVMAVESSGRTAAVSSAGAQGLMQLIPDTAARFGVTDAFDPAQNIAGGIAYLDWLLEEFDGDVVLALAGYNAGEGAVVRAGGVPDYPETRGYVPKVLATWMLARSLCMTPPELPSDGCVFTVMQ